MLIISAPSGGGKSSLAKALLYADENIKLSVSATTRKPRPAEQEAIDYYFKSEEEFAELERQGAFFESAKIYTNYYGTPIAPIEVAIKQNTDILFDIDWQGARTIKQKVSNAVSIFLLPPNNEILKRRLLARNQDSLEEIDRRLIENQKIMFYAMEYDYVIINDDFSVALEQIKAILQAERLKRIRLDQLDNFLKL